MIIDNIRFLGFNQNLEPWIVYVMKQPRYGTWAGQYEGTFLIVKMENNKLKATRHSYTSRQLSYRIQQQVSDGYKQEGNVKIINQHYPMLLEDLSKLIMWETIKGEE